MKLNKDKIPIYLLIIFVIFAILMGINPTYRYVWFVENIILIIFLIIMLISYRYFKFSNRNYFLIFLFCIFQTIGAHYTYAEVPVGFWIQEMFDLTRNHYDRFVHFMYGFLLAYPFREFFVRTSSVKGGFWSYLVPVAIAFACGSIYEVLEWLSTFTLLPETGGDSSLFLGSQGDVWDAEKDMFLVGLGSIISMLITWVKRK